jgi:hypothetical protein
MPQVPPRSEGRVRDLAQRFLILSRPLFLRPITIVRDQWGV